MSYDLWSKGLNAFFILAVRAFLGLNSSNHIDFGSSVLNIKRKYVISNKRNVSEFQRNGFPRSSQPNCIANHYLPLDGMINIPIYQVWGCWVQLNSTQFFADHIKFNNGCMKHAHTRQRMTNNNTNNKRKQIKYHRPSRSAFLRNNRYFEFKLK